MDNGKRILGDPGRLAKLLDLSKAMPEIDVLGDQHLAFKVRKKTFVYYCDDHHSDGIVSIWCKSTTDRRDELVELYPDRYYEPPYVGPKGWVALRLDLPAIDWDEVKSMLFAAYRLQAPRRLAERLES